MRISDWSSDVCSSDLSSTSSLSACTVWSSLMARSPVSGVAATAGKLNKNARLAPRTLKRPRVVGIGYWNPGGLMSVAKQFARYCCDCSSHHEQIMDTRLCVIAAARLNGVMSRTRSEEHTSELQYLMRISYAVFCL